MKILLTVHQFFPEYSSGTEVLTLETAKSLQEKGHDVLVVTGGYAPQPMQDADRFDNYIHDNIPVERMMFSPGFIGDSADMTRLEFDNNLFKARFDQIVQDFQPDIVHFFHLMRLSVTFVDVCKQRGIPTVFTPTDFWFLCPYAQLMLPDHSPCLGPDARAINCIRHFMHSNRLSPTINAVADALPDVAFRAGLAVVRRNLHFRLPIKLATLGENARSVAARLPFTLQRLKDIDRLMVPNAMMKETLQRYGVSTAKMVDQPYGINLAYQHNAPRQPAKTFRIGFMGTLSKHKGAHVLINAIRQFPSDAAIEVKLYGRLTDNPAYVEELRQLIGEDARITLMGGYPNSEIGEVFAHLDVLVVPSIWQENTPLVVYSAQASGCPVIGSDFGGINCVVTHGENGFLFPSGDDQTLGQLLKQLDQDRALLQKLSDNAKPPLSIAGYTDALQTHYVEMVQEKPL